MGESRITSHESRSGAFAEVALNVPLHAGDRVFTFGIPQSLEPRIPLGTPVRLRFGRQTSLGSVARLAEQVDRRVRQIAAVEDRLPVLPEDLVALAWWMAGHYVCTVGEAVAAMLPPFAAALRRTTVDPIVLLQPHGPAPEASAPTRLLAHPSTNSPQVAVAVEDARVDAYSA